MASQTFLFCGPCEGRKAHRQANVWCSVCMEGLCHECENLHKSSKLSKGHTTFDEDLYPLLKPFLKGLITDCNQHHRKYDFYCQTHSALCCVNCVTAEHRQCDVKPIDDESESPRASIAFANLEQDMTDILERIEKIKSSRTDNIKLLNKQKNDIQSEISEARKILNEHLDKLEKEVLSELSAAEQKHSLDIAQTLFEIDTRRQVFVDLQTITDCIKSLDSGIQTMLATNKVGEMFWNEKKEVEKILDEKENENLQLHFQISEKIKNLTVDIKRFGMINERGCRISAKEMPEPVQILEKRGSTRSLTHRNLDTTDPNRIMLKLVKKIKISKRKSKIPSDIRGCVILADSKLLFADWSDNKKLMMFNADGTHNRDIGVTGKPYDIARLDGERIAVSFPEEFIVQIFDVVSSGYPIYQNIKMADQCWGIFYTDEKLFVGCNGHKIQIMNLSGVIMKSIPAKVNTVYCIDADNDFVYYCDEINNTVFCCDFDGNEIWKFREPSLKYPCSVAYNYDGYVFVVGNISQNVMVVSADGQQSKSILSKLDGMDGPAGIHYERQSGRLAIVLSSFKGHVALYDVMARPRALQK